MKYFAYLMFLLAMGCSPKSEQTATTKTEPASEKPDDAMVIVDQPGADTLKGSLRAKAEGIVGGAKFAVRYYSPAVRDRIIWGGLVPFDKVWVTGAHMATSVEVDKNITIAGTGLEAGKYAFMTIPGKEVWILIVNRNWEQHLVDNYDEKLDVLRLVVKPVIREVNQERLQYSLVEDSPSSGRMVVRWEKMEVSLPVTIQP